MFCHADIHGQFLWCSLKWFNLLTSDKTSCSDKSCPSIWEISSARLGMMDMESGARSRCLYNAVCLLLLKYQVDKIMIVYHYQDSSWCKTNDSVSKCLFSSYIADGLGNVTVWAITSILYEGIRCKYMVPTCSNINTGIGLICLL